MRRREAVSLKTGIIDVGGGMRGIYAAGVLDGCMDRKITFDLAIGISAGSANLASFLAGQRGRNFTFYTVYALRPEYMSVGNFLRTHSYIDMDYVYGTLCNAGAEYPLDYETLRDNPTRFLVVAADAETGEPVYFGKDSIRQDDYDIFKASSSIPWVNRPYPVEGRPCFDGACADPVPVQKALQEGCDKLVLLLTKPRDTVRNSRKDDRLARMIRRRYPQAARGIHLRAKRYNEGVALARELEAQGRALIVAPDDTCGIDTLRRDADAMKRLYEKGLRDAEDIRKFLKE